MQRMLKNKQKLYNNLKQFCQINELNDKFKQTWTILAKWQSAANSNPWRSAHNCTLSSLIFHNEAQYLEHRPDLGGCGIKEG